LIVSFNIIWHRSVNFSWHTCPSGRGATSNGANLLPCETVAQYSFAMRKRRKRRGSLQLLRYRSVCVTSNLVRLGGPYQFAGPCATLWELSENLLSPVDDSTVWATIRFVPAVLIGASPRLQKDADVCGVHAGNSPRPIGQDSAGSRAGGMLLNSRPLMDQQCRPWSFAIFSASPPARRPSC